MPAPIHSFENSPSQARNIFGPGRNPAHSRLYRSGEKLVSNFRRSINGQTAEFSVPVPRPGPPKDKAEPSVIQRIWCRVSKNQTHPAQQEGRPSPAISLAATGAANEKENSVCIKIEKKFSDLEERFARKTLRDAKNSDCVKFTATVRTWLADIEATCRKYESRHNANTSNNTERQDLVGSIQESRENAYRNLRITVENGAASIHDNMAARMPSLNTSKDLKAIAEQRLRISAFRDTLRQTVSSSDIKNQDEMMATLDRHAQSALEAFDRKFSENISRRLHEKIKEDLSTFQKSFADCDTVRGAGTFISKAKQYRASINKHHPSYTKILQALSQSGSSINDDALAEAKNSLIEQIHKNQISALVQFNEDVTEAVTSIYGRFVESQVTRINLISVHGQESMGTYADALNHSHDKLLRLTMVMNSSGLLSEADVEAGLPASSFRKIIDGTSGLHNVHENHDTERESSFVRFLTKNVKPKITGKLNFSKTTSKVLLAAGAGITAMGLALVTIIPGANLLAGIALIALGITAITPYVTRHADWIIKRLGKLISRIGRKKTLLESVKDLRESTSRLRLPDLKSRLSNECPVR